jgi:hypothetical protein
MRRPRAGFPLLTNSDGCTHSEATSRRTGEAEAADLGIAAELADATGRMAAAGRLAAGSRLPAGAEGLAVLAVPTRWSDNCAGPSEVGADEVPTARGSQRRASSRLLERLGRRRDYRR